MEFYNISLNRKPEVRQLIPVSKRKIPYSVMQQGKCATATKHFFSLFLLILCFILSLSANAQCPVCPQGATKVEGGKKSYSLNKNSVYCFSGTFTGSINSFPAGAKIYVTAGATFNPKSINNAGGEIYNCGTVGFRSINASSGFMAENYGEAVFNQSVNLNSEAAFTNHGVMTFSQSVNLTNGVVISNMNELQFQSSVNFNGAASLYNEDGSKMHLKRGASLMNGATITNLGHMVLERGDISTLSGTALVNKGIFQVMTGNVNLDGSVENYALFDAAGTININSNATVKNYCTLLARKNLNNNASILNEGFVLCEGEGSTINNNGSLINGESGRVQGVNFTNNRTVTGKGSFYFTGRTITQGSFATGAGDKIAFYDSSPTENSIFDTQTTPIGHVTRSELLPLPEDFESRGCYSSGDIGTLPVELAVFRALSTAQGAVLQWKTASEQDNDHFDVERSADGRAFRKIASIPGHGTSHTPQSYQYLDKIAGSESSTYYYRLKQVDTDSSFAYSPIVFVQQQQQKITLQAYPNPFRNSVSVLLPPSFGNSADVALTDMKGRVHFQGMLKVNDAGMLHIENVESLSPDLYLLRLRCNDAVTTIKLLKQ